MVNTVVGLPWQYVVVEMGRVFSTPGVSLKGSNSTLFQCDDNGFTSLAVKKKKVLEIPWQLNFSISKP